MTPSCSSRRYMCTAHRCIDRLAQERRSSSTLAMELRLSCTDPSAWLYPTVFVGCNYWSCILYPISVQFDSSISIKKTCRQAVIILSMLYSCMWRGSDKAVAIWHLYGHTICLFQLRHYKTRRWTTADQGLLLQTEMGWTNITLWHG